MSSSPKVASSLAQRAQLDELAELVDLSFLAELAQQIENDELAPTLPAMEGLGDASNSQSNQQRHYSSANGHEFPTLPDTQATSTSHNNLQSISETWSQTSEAVPLAIATTPNVTQAVTVSDSSPSGHLQPFPQTGNTSTVNVTDTATATATTTATTTATATATATEMLQNLEHQQLTFLQQKCWSKLFDLINTYRQYSQESLPEPVLTFDLKSRTVAGLAVYPNIIRLNPQFLLRERDHYIDNVVGHELAHFIVFHQIKQRKFSARVKPHGKEWQHYMHVLGIEPNVYHTYDLLPSKSATFRYICKCKVHELTAIRHKRSMAGTCYYCRKCKATLRYAPDEQVTPNDYEQLPVVQPKHRRKR